MKYMGSKSRIAREIVPIMQAEIEGGKYDTYVEPFVGGANVIDKIKCKYRVGFDINRYLTALLQHVQAGGYCRKMSHVKHTGTSGKGVTPSLTGWWDARASLRPTTGNSSAGMPAG